MLTISFSFCGQDLAILSGSISNVILGLNMLVDEEPVPLVLLVIIKTPLNILLSEENTILLQEIVSALFMICVMALSRYLN